MQEERYRRHLAFLEAVFEGEEERCALAFAQAHRDVRKALLALLAPPLSLDSLWEAIEKGESAVQTAAIPQLFLYFCPNPAYAAVMEGLRLRQWKSLPDTETQAKLQQFRRVPSPAELDRLWRVVRSDSAPTVALLKALRPFGRELGQRLPTLWAYAQDSDIAVVDAALELLAEVPQGIEQSLGVLQQLFQQPALRFYVLRSLQRGYGVAATWLYQLFRPVMDEYERLSRVEGPQNALWEEVQLMRQLLLRQGFEGQLFWLDIKTSS